MPSSTLKQANTAKLAGAVKAGKFPASKAGPAVKSMAKMSMDKLKHFMKMKESLSVEEKRKLLIGLKLVKKQLEKENIVLSPQEPMWISEFTETPEKNIISKTFKTTGDFDSFVNQNRGIQFAPKEMEAITNFEKEIEPTALDPFMIRFETVDDFGNNTKTTIKKYKQGSQFTFVAFSSHDQVNKPEETPDENPEIPAKKSMERPMTAPKKEPTGGKPAENPMTPSLKENVDPDPNEIIVTKTITFQDDTQGSGILANFLRKLDL